MKDTKIVILGAGKGKRLQSLGFEVPKPLIPIHGRPMILHLIDAINESNVDASPILVTASDNIQMFSEALTGTGCKYAIQEEQLGTGHATACAKDHFNTADHVMVLYGDHPTITADTIRKIAEEHSASGATMTMATVKFPDFESWRQWFFNFGRIIRDEAGKIIKIVEKKDASEEELIITEVNPSYFVFNRAWLLENIGKLKNNNAQQEYYLTDLVGIAFDQGQPIHDLIIENAIEAIGINTPEQLKAAEEALTPSD